MYTAIVVAPVCRFESLIGTVCSSIVVQRDCVGVYMVIPRVVHEKVS